MRVELRQADLNRTMRSLWKNMPKVYYAEAIVGYDTGLAPYAVYVHEDLSASHKAPRRAKFLEEPSRLLRPLVSAMFFVTYQSTRSLSRAIYSAALVLYNASQRLVPVDTGWLKNSGFVVVVRTISRSGSINGSDTEKKFFDNP